MITRWLTFPLMIMTGASGNENSHPRSESADTVVLVDSSVSVESLAKFSNQKSARLITMDYESHKTLHKNGIEHEISDSYLSEDDLREIQEKSYSFSRWFENPQLNLHIEYKGINLGQLFYVEFHYMLVPILKKFMELMKIYNQFTKAKFLVPIGLYEGAKSFTNNVKSIEGTSVSEKLLYDSIKVNLQLGSKPLTLQFSKSSYERIKTLSEKIFDSLSSSDGKGRTGNRILLVEFDTIRYSKIFTTISKFSLVPIIYARRRPAIWNLKSLSIIKKSKTSVIVSPKITDENKASIKNVQNEMTQKINLLLTQDDNFRSFFSIVGFSFWMILKPLFTKLCKKRMIEAIEEIELVEKLFDEYKPNLVLVWSEAGFNEQIVVKMAKLCNIQVLLLQHGLYYDTPEAYEFNRFAGVLPILSDKFLVWGDILAQYATASGISSSKITPIGSPIYDDLFSYEKKNSDEKDGFILLATSGPVNNLINDLTVKTNAKYEESIRKVCHIVSKMNKKLVIKLHPFSEEQDISRIAKEVSPNIIVTKASNIFTLIKKCEVMIMTDLSTAILEAQILQKPVISLAIKNYGFGTPSIFESSSCVKTDLDNFENNLKKILHDDSFRLQTIKNGNKYVESYFANRGNSSTKLLELLEKI